MALAALKGDRTLADLAHQLDVHPNQITDRKSRLQERAAGVFGEDKAEQQAGQVDVTRMQAKISELPREDDFLERALTKAGSMNCTGTIRSRAAGCCAICWHSAESLLAAVICAR